MSGWGEWTKPYCDQGVHHIGIYDFAGNPWTCTNLNMTPQEGAKLASAIKNKDSSIYSEGLMINGEKWAVVNRDDDDDLLNIKGKDDSNRQKTMTIAMCGRCMVLGANKDGGLPGGAVCAKVAHLQKSLKEKGY